MIYMSVYRDIFPGPKVLEEHNIESSVHAQIASSFRLSGDRSRWALWRATALAMATYENSVWPSFSLRTTVSETDRMAMEARCGAGRSIVIPNGADTTRPLRSTSPGSGRILFTRALAYEPSVDAACYLAERIMPTVWSYEPTLSLVVAGKEPIAVVRALARPGRVEVLPNPHSMDAIVDTCSVLAVPLRRGGGTRLKILAAFGWGLPVVSTSIGCAGLDVEDGVHVLIRDDPDEFAAALLRLLTDLVLWDKLRLAARRLVEERYDWRRVFAGLEAELQRYAN
jgi:glycosyltransferase involved in cell wall biosynthesis